MSAANHAAYPMRWKIVFGTLLFIACIASLGCAQASGSRPRSIRISIIPTTDPAGLLRRSGPLVQFWERSTQRKIEITIPTNYAAVVEGLVNDKVDIAYLGGFTYVQAARRSHILPLVQRDRDQQFHSVFVTYSGSAIHSLPDLAGHSFAFGDVNSTSGHLMPEYYLRRAGEERVISNAIYSGGHDATLLAVAHRKVDAGALDELVLKAMLKSGVVRPQEVRTFYTTPPFVDYVWVARQQVDPKVSQKFTDAMLSLSRDNPQDRELLDLLNADKYVPADDGRYTTLRAAAREAGLLR